MSTVIRDYHADDYGLSVGGSEIIIDCISKKRLSSISIIPNMHCYEECMELLHKAWAELEVKPLITVHINLVDGIGLAGGTGMVTDENGFIKTSWKELLMRSIMPGKGRTEFRRQLAEEIYAQIEAVYDRLPEGCELRLDSHMHTHMIPVVREALFDAADRFCDERGGIRVGFVRVAREPIMPYLMTFSLWHTYSPVNWIKNILLNMLAGPMERELGKRNISYGLLWGLVMSGHMDRLRCEKLMDRMFAYADKKGKTMEILYHPGRITEDEVTDAHCKPDITSFYVSPNRDIELEAVLKANRLE